MPKLELVLDAPRSTWDLSASHGTVNDRSRRVKEFYELVLKRDKYTCQGCSWRAEEHMCIHPKDGNHRSRSLENWVTLCPFCHQVFHMPQTSSSGGGKLIWLPEISQGTLNLLCIPLFLAGSSPKHPYYQLATTLKAALETRAQFFRSKHGTYDPMMMAQIIVSMSPEEYADRAQVLSNIRLLPNPERFEDILFDWERTVFKDWDTEKWEKCLPADFDLAQLMPEEPDYASAGR